MKTQVTKNFFVKIPAPLPVPGQVLNKFRSLLEQADSCEELITAASAAGFEITINQFLKTVSWNGYVLAFEVIEFKEVNEQLTYRYITFYSI